MAPNRFPLRPSAVNSFPTDRHGLVHRSNVVRCGGTDAQLARAVAAGELVRVTRGVFTRRTERTPEQTHRLMGIATGSSDGSVVVSHQSAATLHRLEMLRPQLRRIHLTVGVGVKAHRTAVRHEHEAHLADHEITTIDGVLVTSLERTAVDVSGTSSMGLRGLSPFWTRRCDWARIGP